jgi:hypothetical protein
MCFLVVSTIAICRHRPDCAELITEYEVSIVLDPIKANLSWNGIRVCNLISKNVGHLYCGIFATKQCGCWEQNSVM